MSEIFKAVILGIIQGIAEFLPISSSAHLIVLPELYIIIKDVLKIFRLSKDIKKEKYPLWSE